jgi:hypothetical protein
MTLVGKGVALLDQNRNVYLLRLLNPASGANNVVVTFSNVHYIIPGAAEYGGVGSFGAWGLNYSAGDANTLTSTLTTTTANSWIALAEESYETGNSSPTAGAGDTLRAVETVYSTWGLFDSGAAIATPGAYSMTTNRANNSHAIVHLMVEMIPAASVSIPAGSSGAVH